MAGGPRVLFGSDDARRRGNRKDFGVGGEEMTFREKLAQEHPDAFVRTIVEDAKTALSHTGTKREQHLVLLSVLSSATPVGTGKCP